MVRSLGGRIREVRIDALVEGAYAASVELEGPHGIELVVVQRRGLAASTSARQLGGRPWGTCWAWWSTGRSPNLAS